jgi:putative tricarboxylic transport membrane protein
VDLINGFQVALQPANLFFCFIGVFVGTLIGVLPGIGPTAAIALLLPTTFSINPTGAIIMLAGIYYGAMYGGSTTSVLVNIPGESSSVVTCLDGYAMARQGRAGAALGISAFGSFIAGSFSIVVLQLVAAPLATIALTFGPPEYFSLMCLGLVILFYLGGGSVSKNIMMGLLGLILSFIGLDPFTAAPRFTFGMMQFVDGISFVPLIMGLFGVAEVLGNIEEPERRQEILQTDFKGLLPTLNDWRDSIGAIFRGSIIGFFLGILPGGGATISSFVSYGIEKKISRHPERFGRGAIEGVAGPESANNAAIGGSLVPLLTLGIPTNSIIALLLAALIIHGVRPGPEMIAKHPDVFWGFIASMYLGNAMLLLLNLPLIGLWVQILRIPYRILFPLILLFTIIGSYSTNNSIFDIQLMLVFGVLGYVLKKLEFELTPLVMAFVLGPMLEQAFRQSLIISRGSFDFFLIRPISLAFLVLAVFVVFLSSLPILRRRWFGSLP